MLRRKSHKMNLMLNKMQDFAKMNMIRFSSWSYSSSQTDCAEVGAKDEIKM